MASVAGLQELSDDEQDEDVDQFDDILESEASSGPARPSGSGEQLGDGDHHGVAGERAAARAEAAVPTRSATTDASARHGVVQLERIPIEKDNNCLFSAIAYLCTRQQSSPVSAGTLRREIAENIRGDPETFTQVALGMLPDEYCAWIQDSQNWGGETEICMLCERFNVEIQIVMLNQRGTSLTYGESAHKQRSGRIFLLYSGQHYDALVGRQHHETIKIFETGDSETSSLAVAFACEEAETPKTDNTSETSSLALALALQACEEAETSNDMFPPTAAVAPCAPVSAPPALEAFRDFRNAEQCAASPVGGWAANTDPYLAAQRASWEISSRLLELHELARGAVTPEADDLIRSLHLAQKLTDEDLKMMQEQEVVLELHPILQQQNYGA
jgi:hypothetical protein